MTTWWDKHWHGVLEPEHQAGHASTNPELSHVGGFNPYGDSYARYGDGSKFAGGISHSGSSIVVDHHTLRINARKAYHDVPQARAIVDRFADIVVDTGLQIQPTPDYQLLGLSAEAAEGWAERVGRRFDLWMGSKDCFRSGAMTGYQAQRMYQIFQQRDNDIFVRLHYSGEGHLQSNLQFSFIDPSQIRGDAYTSTSGFNGDISDGIERDDAGREVSFKVWVKNKNGQYEDKNIDAVGATSGRRLMLHGFSPEYAGQGRGYSRLGHALQEFQNITDFSLAVLNKAINQSNIAMFTESKDERDAPNPFDGITGKAGPASTQFGSNPLPSGDAKNVTDESVMPVEYSSVPGANIGTPGSVGVFNLQGNSTLKAFPNSSPADSFDTFVDSFFSYISASMSMPIEIVLMKFGNNYAASRGTLILFWRIAWIWRHEMDADFLTPVFELWLAEEIAAGRESAPGWSDPRLRAAWLAHDLIGSPVPNIDDVKSAKANKMNLEINATTFDRAASDTNGSNGKSNRSKLMREVKEWQQMPWVVAK